MLINPSVWGFWQRKVLEKKRVLIRMQECCSLFAALKMLSYLGKVLFSSVRVDWCADISFPCGLQNLVWKLVSTNIQGLPPSLGEDKSRAPDIQSFTVRGSSGSASITMSSRVTVVTKRPVRFRLQQMALMRLDAIIVIGWIATKKRTTLLQVK
jgi:hypothetical protein